MTIKSTVDLLYEAADLAGFDASQGWPEELEPRQFLSLMLGHRWLPQLREPEPITVEHPDGRIEQLGFTPDLRLFETPDEARRRKASGILVKMLGDAGLRAEERIETIPQPPKRCLRLSPPGVVEVEQPPTVRKSFVFTRKAVAACLHSIGKPPSDYVRAWLGPMWKGVAPKKGRGGAVASQRDKPDFQEKCRAVWESEKTLPITGAEGITYHRDLIDWHQKYNANKLAAWAREVAPEGVRNKRGRRPKKSTLAEK